MHLWSVREHGDKSLKVISHTWIMARALNCIFTAPGRIYNHRSTITAQECGSLEAWKTGNDAFMPFLHLLQHTLQDLRFDGKFHYFCDSRRPVTISDNRHLP